MLDCTSARSLSGTPFSGLTDSLRASTVNHTAGPGAVAVDGSACDRRIDPVFVSGRGEQARFSDMNRERTALGVNSLFRLIGTGEYNDRRGQMRNEQPGDANHQSASGVMVKNSRQGKYGLSLKTLFPQDIEP